MQFLPSLKVKLPGCGAKLGESALQVWQRCPEFRSGTDAGTATNDEFNAEKAFKRLDSLPRSGGGQPEQFTGPLERSRSNRELERLE